MFHEFLFRVNTAPPSESHISCSKDENIKKMHPIEKIKEVQLYIL